MKESLNFITMYFQESINKIISFSPKILGAIGLLLLGFIIGKLLQKISYKIFILFGINRIAHKSGIDNLFRSINIKTNFSAILGKLIFWIVILVFFIPVVNILGLTFISVFIKQIIDYMPKFLIALLIVLIGTWLSKIISGYVRGSANRINSEYADIASALTNLMVVFLTIIIALRQLNIQIGILTSLILIAFATFGLGLGLAFALGVKDILKMVIASYYINRSLNKTRYVKFNDLEGKIIEVSSLTTVIQSKNGDLISIPNHRFLEK